jgi:hypothetical protein
LLLWPLTLSEAQAWTASVFVDEFDAAFFQCLFDFRGRARTTPDFAINCLKTSDCRL